MADVEIAKRPPSDSEEASDHKRARIADGKRDRKDRRGTGVDANAEAEGSEARLPKRKVAVKFGYCGIGYSGLQINPGVKTIEGDIFDAFCKAGAVSKENSVNPNKVGLLRAARTDRGVHAAGNLISLKLILEPNGMAEGQTLEERVNEFLPDIIRIWGITRVQNGFNARTSCCSRQYEYLLPTYVFLPPKPGSAMHDMFSRMRTEELAKEGNNGTTSLDETVDHPFWKEHGTEHDFAIDVKAKKQWRIPAEQVERIRSIFQFYSGSHNFHNFTVAKEFRDRSNQRNMKRLTIADPTIINGTEWISIKIHGQSFMLHQIRKMIGLLVLIARSNTPASLITKTYGPTRIHVPKAPGLGLLLEQPIFEAYNNHIANNNNRLDRKATIVSEDERRDPIQYQSHEDEMQRFKQTYIYDRIMVTEQETNEFAKWLNYLDVFQGPDFEFLNPAGVIPPHIALKKGEIPGTDKKSKSTTNVDDDEEDDEALGKKGKALEEYEG